MAIKNRRGEYANFDPYKMLQGEWGITTSGDPNSADGKSVYMCFAAGNVKRMATYDDMVENIDRATEKVQERLTQEVREATAEANSTIQKATQATQSANTAADRANEAAEAAESYVLGDISGKTVTFEMAIQRANIQSNDSLAVAFGKLAKFCADLDDHAFSAPVPNLLSDDSTKSLAASMGKALKTDIGDLTQLPTTAKGSLVEAITEQNSAFADRRCYCIDSGWTNYFTLNLPAGTNALVVLTQAIYRVESITNDISISKLATLGDSDDSVCVKYTDNRYVAFRRADAVSNIRAMVFTSYSNVTRRS